MTIFGGDDDDDHNGDEIETAYIFILNPLKTQMSTKHNKQEAQEP